MRILHSDQHSVIQGKASEKQKINKWCEVLKRLNDGFSVVTDDSEGDEISLTIVIEGTTQKERSELADRAKQFEVVKKGR